MRTARSGGASARPFPHHPFFGIILKKYDSGFESEDRKMQIEKRLGDGRLELKVVGRLDTNTSPDLEAELALDGVQEVVFDFAELEYISSAGLRVLMFAQKAMMACGGKMSVLNPNETVKGIFDITGMSSIFTIV